jgi:hypothetical protein
LEGIDMDALHAMAGKFPSTVWKRIAALMKAHACQSE